MANECPTCEGVGVLALGIVLTTSGVLLGTSPSAADVTDAVTEATEALNRARDAEAQRQAAAFDKSLETLVAVGEDYDLTAGSTVTIKQSGAPGPDGVIPETTITCAAPEQPETALRAPYEQKRPEPAPEQPVGTVVGLWANVEPELQMDTQTSFETVLRVSETESDLFHPFSMENDELEFDHLSSLTFRPARVDSADVPPIPIGTTATLLASGLTLLGLRAHVRR